MNGKEAKSLSISELRNILFELVEYQTDEECYADALRELVKKARQNKDTFLLMKGYQKFAVIHEDTLALIYADSLIALAANKKFSYFYVILPIT